MSDSVVTVNLRDAAERTRTRTIAENRDTLDIWEHGIVLLGRNSSAVDRWSSSDVKDLERDHVLVALLTHAANTEICGFELATMGYATQAQALIRICEEDWLAWWYLRTFPEEADRFLNFGPGAKKSPNANDMVQALERKLGTEALKPVRAQIKWLHTLTHVDWTSVRGSYDVLPTDHPSVNATEFRVGPHYSQENFINCAGQFMAQLVGLNECAVPTCRIIGVTPREPHADDKYARLFNAWMAKVTGEAAGRES